MAGYITSPFFHMWDYQKAEGAGEVYRNEFALWWKAHSMGTSVANPIHPQTCRNLNQWEREVSKNWFNTLASHNMHWMVSLHSSLSDNVDPTKSWEWMLETNWAAVSAEFATELNYYQSSPNRLVQLDGLTVNAYHGPEFDLVPTIAGTWPYGWNNPALSVHIEHHSRIINWLWTNYVPSGGTLRYHLSPYIGGVVDADSTTYGWIYDNTLNFLNGVATSVNQSTRNIYIYCAPQDGCGNDGSDLIWWGLRDPRPGYDTDGTFAKLLLILNAHYSAFAASNQAAKNTARVNAECLRWLDPTVYPDFNSRYYHQLDRMQSYTTGGFVAYAMINLSGYTTFFNDYSKYLYPMSVVTWMNT